MDFEGRKGWKGVGRELFLLLLQRVKEGSVGVDVEANKPKIREKEGEDR